MWSNTSTTGLTPPGGSPGGDAAGDNALLEALRAARSQIEGGAQPKTGITTAEYAAAQGISIHTANRILNRMADDGRLERVMILRMDGWGFWQHRKGFDMPKGSE